MTLFLDGYRTYPYEAGDFKIETMIRRNLCGEAEIHAFQWLLNWKKIELKNIKEQLSSLKLISPSLYLVNISYAPIAPQRTPNRCTIM